MDDGRQIVAELQHYFHMFLVLRQNYWTDLHQNFTQYSGISGIEGVTAFHFRTPEQRVKVVDFDVYQNAPKLIGHHSNVPLATENLCQFCNPHTYDYLR